MNKKNFSGLVVFMAVSIFGIIAVQLIWMNNAIQVKNELFSRSVNDALNSTAKKLEDRQNLNVVNRIIFSDSLKWNDNRENYDFHFETMPAPPPVPDSFRTPPRPVQMVPQKELEKPLPLVWGK